MRGNSGLLLIGAGLAILYIAISGKYQCVESFVYCFFGLGGDATDAGATTPAPAASDPVLTPGPVLSLPGGSGPVAPSHSSGNTGIIIPIGPLASPHRTIATPPFNPNTGHDGHNFGLPTIPILTRYN